MSEPVSVSQVKGDVEKLRGYVGAMKELREACADLVPGQMVCSPDFTLTDSMAALQIMDPRMDSGIDPIPEHLVAECDRFPGTDEIPTFDPLAQLSAAEICWIMDRLLACEIEWHRGAALSQTVHTCLYVHSMASIHPSASLVAGQEPNLLVTRILRPFLMMFLKSIGLVWDEVSKGNIADGEDFNCDKGGVSLLEGTGLEEVEAWLQDAVSHVQALREHSSNARFGRNDMLTGLEADALLVRIQLQESLFKAISTFAKVDPTLRFGQGLDPMQVLSTLPSALHEAQRKLEELQRQESAGETKLYSLMSPNFSDAPSIRAMSAFDPAYSRRPAHLETYNAPSAPPPALPLSLKKPEETIASYKEILKGLYETMQLATGNVGWAKWKTSLSKKAIDFQKEITFPYIRSLWQSVVYCDDVVGFRFTLNWIADSFLEQEAGLDCGVLARLTSNASNHVGEDSKRLTSLKKRTEYYLERLAGQLVNNLCSLAQNRSRGRRRLAGSYEALLELSTEAVAIDASLIDTFGTQIGTSYQTASAVQALTLDTMLHIVYSGFELELYRLEECAMVYWLAQRIAEERFELLDAMQAKRNKVQRQETSAYLQSQIYSTKAIAEASKAMGAIFESSYSGKVRPLPWTPSLEDTNVLEGLEQRSEQNIISSFEALDKASFCKRFKWLRGKGRPEGMQTLDTLWNDYQADRRAMSKRTTRERLDWSARSLEAAVLALKQVPKGHEDSHILALIDLLQQNTQICQSGVGEATRVSLLPLTYSHTLHPWFPALYTQQP